VYFSFLQVYCDGYIFPRRLSGKKTEDPKSKRKEEKNNNKS
jgi:hypothetical protein